MKATDGASGSGLPPKKLREDHGTSGDVGASTGGKSLAAIQELFEQSTLNVEVSVTAAATVPFVTSSMTPTPEREEGGRTDSVTGPNLRIQRATERFVVLSDSSHHSSTNAADDEVTSIFRSSMLPPHVLIAAIATTIVTNAISASVPEGDVDSKTFHQTYIPKWNVTNDSALDDLDICRGVIDHLAPPALFFQLYSMDYEQLFVEFNVGAACQTSLGSEVRLRLEHELRGRKKIKDKCAMQAGWLKERNAEIANLKAQLSLKQDEAAEAIRLRGQIAIVETAKAARASDLESLKERNADLEGHVVALEFASVTKDFELTSSNTHIVKLTQNLSNLQLFCDELSIKASSLEFEKDKLVDQLSKLEGTCSELRDEVSSYKLFKEHIEAVQDVQVKVLSDRVAELDVNLMGMALHLYEEFYPRFLTTIARAIGRAIDKGMSGGLTAGIDHGKAGMGLTDVAAYDPSAEANYLSAVSALRDVNFPLLAQLES
ncbi:hypothetical protein Tco_0299234, partial [Tanacetum coccineum]